jgi:hypothetical protein
MEFDIARKQKQRSEAQAKANEDLEAPPTPPAKPADKR